MDDLDRSIDDSELLRRLGRVWERRDPPPDGLADDLLAYLSAADLDKEWAMLRLVSSTGLTGVRGVSDVQTLEFELGEIALLIRVAPESSTRGRMDGWLTSASNDLDAGTVVTLLTDDGAFTTAIDVDGRFEFSGVHGHRWRLRFSAADGTELVQTPQRNW